MHTLVQEVSLAYLWGFAPMEQVLWDVWSESWYSGFLLLQESSSPYLELILSQPDLSINDLHSFPSSFPPGNLSITFPCCTGQIRLSGHSRDLYIKKILLWGFLYIVFLFVFYGLRRELANCEPNLILLPADIFWLPGKNLCYQGQFIALWSVLYPPKFTDSSNPTLHSFLNKSLSFFAVIYEKHEKTYLESWVLYV